MIAVTPFLPGGEGANWDLSPHQLPTGQWSDARNVRVYSGKTQRVQKPSVYRSTVDSVPRFGKEIRLSTGNGYLIVYNDKVELELGGVITDVTPNDVVMVDSDQWTAVQIGDAVALNSPNMHPLYRAPGDAIFRRMPGWDPVYRARGITALNSILVAYSLIIAGTAKANHLAFSDPVDPDTGLVVWQTAADNRAGEVPYASSGGPMVEVAPLDDALYVYFEKQVWRATYIGGNFVFADKAIFNDGGVFSRRCVAVFSDQGQEYHLVVGNNNIYIHNGVGKIPISEGVVTKRLLQDIGSARYVFTMVSHSTFEVFIFYSTATNTYADQALVYNFRFKKWTRLDAAAMGNTLISYAFTSPDQPKVGKRWGEETRRWAEMRESWGGGLGGVFDRIFALDVVGRRILRLDSDDTLDITFVRPPMLLERLDMDFSDRPEMGASTDALRYLSYMVLQMRGAGEVVSQVGSRNNLNEEIRWKSQESHRVTRQKIDRRVTGRYISLRVLKNDSLDFAIEGVAFAGGAYSAH